MAGQNGAANVKEMNKSMQRTTQAQQKHIKCWAAGQFSLRYL